MGTKGTPTKCAELLAVLMDFKHSYQLLITMLTTLQTMTCERHENTSENTRQ